MVEGHAFCNPLHDANGKLILPLRYLLDAYKQKDPPVLPQLAVPLELIIKSQQMLPPRGKQYERAALLIGIAYFYLLRVGEYTKPRKQTRTVQFRLKDIMFWKNNTALNPGTTPRQILATADAATLRIENQKNGIKNQTIHHEVNDRKDGVCPVALLLKLTLALLDDSATDDTLICSYKLGSEWFHIEDKHITELIKWIAKNTGLHNKGFPINRVGSHSLRAGGAMALKLNGIDDVLIKKYGRWTSDTFITYIHEQIAHLAAGVSTAMSKSIVFYNVAGFAT